MKVFFDTSALFKLYHQETNSDFVESIFSDFRVIEIFLSEITKAEFASTAWKKFRMQEITEEQVNGLLNSFETDFKKYTFVQVDNIVIEQSRNLLNKYGRQGLKTLDSIQLSTAVLLNNTASLFITNDNLLNYFFKQEGLTAEWTNK